MFVAIIAMLVFLLRGLRKGNYKLIHRLYFFVTVTIIIWMLGVIAANFVDPSNEEMLRICDAITYVGGAFAPVFSLLIALAFTLGLEKLPKKYYLFFILPVVTNLIAWTNPHHFLL